ncbi:MAG: pilus assembly protein [Porphyrobacter sp.]|nr:pilus assembly protein [Porphyrobacter sp.]
MTLAKLLPAGLTRRLRLDQRGVAFIEFAVTLPILLVLMSSGLELANYVITLKRIGEIAALTADNASRMGAQSAIRNKPISEAEINDVFVGANLQAGSIDLAQNGRIILSSLQRNGSDQQLIKWQRCFGDLTHASSYGVEGDTPADGMGPANDKVMAAPGTAVMVVEIAYEYKPLVPLISLPLGEITDYAAFNVRDDRDLSEVYNTDGDDVSTCS